MIDERHKPSVAERRKLWQMLDAKPGRLEKLVVVLRIFAGESFEDIAESLKITEKRAAEIWDSANTRWQHRQNAARRAKRIRTQDRRLKAVQNGENKA